MRVRERGRGNQGVCVWYTRSAGRPASARRGRRGHTAPRRCRRRREDGGNLRDLTEARSSPAGGAERTRVILSSVRSKHADQSHRSVNFGPTHLQLPVAGHQGQEGRQVGELEAEEGTPQEAEETLVGVPVAGERHRP